MGGIANAAGAALRLSARVLFPPACPGCKDRVGTAGMLCPDCWRRMRFIERPFCPVLGLPFSADPGDGVLSVAAIADPPPFARARSAVAYEDVARQMAQGLKFHDRTDLAPWMARLMLRAGGELVADSDAVIPVPLHRWRFLSRRFNQSAELSRALARLTRRAHLPEALVRRRPTRRQVGLGAAARERNVRGAFDVPREHVAKVAGRRILLVDDVYTTGATVAAAARALKRAGARDVDVLTFARVLPGDFRPPQGDPI